MAKSSFFLRLNEFAPCIAAQHSMSWNPRSIRRKCIFNSRWNCFIHMSNKTTIKKVFLQSKVQNCSGINWQCSQKNQRRNLTWANSTECAVWMRWSTFKSNIIMNYSQISQSRSLAGSVKTGTFLIWAFRIPRKNRLYTCNEFKHAQATLNHGHVTRCGSFISRPH